MSEASIVPITRRALADAIDSLDDQIAALQNAKREEFNAYRDQLSKAGYKPAAARAEVEACKAAMRKRRAAAKDQQAVEDRDALVDEIFEEISSPRARRATHAREDEAGSLPADTGPSESLDGGAIPDVAPPERTSETEGAGGRSETPAGGQRRSVAAAQGIRSATRKGSPEPQRDAPFESAEQAVEAQVTYAGDLPTDPSDPGPVPDFLRRTDGTGPAAAMLREAREQAAKSSAK